MITRRQFMVGGAATSGLLATGLLGCDRGSTAADAGEGGEGDASGSDTGGGGTTDSVGTGPDAAADTTSGPAGKKNIVFITVDEMRTLELLPGAVALPAIESLKKRGFNFTGHHIASCVCTPARSVIYTGQHVPHTKMADNINFPYISDMDPSVKTIGHLLTEAGYYPAYKGKWHLSDIATSKTDPNCTTTGLTTDALEPYGFHDYNDCGDEHGRMLSGATTDEDTAAAAVKWLEEKAGTLGKPWFLAVNFVNPHDIMFYDTDGPGPQGQTQKSDTQVPITPAPKRAPYDATRTVTLPASLTEAFDKRPAGHDEFRKITEAVFGEIPVARKDLWEKYAAYYLNCHADVDSRIQIVLDKLDALGLTKDTIVVFLADHGELAGAHGLRQKGGFIYRENTNVPFVIAHPDYAGGVDVPATMSAVDIAPTLLALAGVDDAALKGAHPELVGHSFAGHLERPDDAGPRADKGLLFIYDSLSTVDAAFSTANASPFANVGQSCSSVELDTSKRGFVRAVYDGQHRLARWYAPVGYNTPKDLTALFENNDVELLLAGHGTASDTPLDAKAAENAAVVESLRAKLEALIAGEVGADGYTMPVLTTC